MLRRRVLARLPASEVGHDADGAVIVSHRNVKITEAVMDRFQELLVSDRGGYDERLNYFEVNFDAAVGALRRDGRRKALKEENRSEPRMSRWSASGCAFVMRAISVALAGPWRSPSASPRLAATWIAWLA
jgi:hypothetical protein